MKNKRKLKKLKKILLFTNRNKTNFFKSDKKLMKNN